MTSNFSLKHAPHRLVDDGVTIARQIQSVMFSHTLHLKRIAKDHGNRLQKLLASMHGVQGDLGEASRQNRLLEDAVNYAVDAWQRSLLMLDVLRERGNNDIAHEASGTPPVQIYESEVVLDGRDLPRPVNYMLLRIFAPEGVATYERKRPYMIIDPRAGHGAGIGGFKPDSQVGVALRHGHPVYFVVFRPHPEPGQTLADVMRAEAAFVHEIRRRHPDSAKPIIVGNCQGGWAALILAAANPEITGPLVVNGAPVACWSGRLGESPMRYNGGLFGGVLPALILADLGDGEFDGAHLVANFEALNPGRNFFGKYYDLYANVDKARDHFLQFERWWGGFHFLNEAEIRWIVEQLFIGNRLSRGEARIEHGRNLDLKSIRSPIIVFASRGDNITPPSQALNWIADTYIDEHEIKIRGQRIVYMVHDKVGHLGIFVSSSIAKKEHEEVTSTLRRIEALPSGLYEMTIDDEIGKGFDTHFLVSFHERKMSQLKAITGDRSEEHNFAAVARLSELGAELYDLTLRPFVQSMITSQAAEAVRRLHPSRVQRLMFSDQNLPMLLVGQAARYVMRERKPVDPANPFLALEKWWVSAIYQGFDLMRDIRDAACEAAFLSIYNSPLMNWIGVTHAFERTRKDRDQLRYLPEVQAILLGIDRGGFVEAVIRMLILLAESRGSVREDRLERSARVLSKDEPFASLGAERRTAIIREQSIIVEFEPQRGIETLPQLISGLEERKRAMEVVEFIVGSVEEMEPQTIRVMQQLHESLGFPTLVFPSITQDPLAEEKVA
jgi:pimeloyl-ACP methyl ester carboxylesterase